MMKKMSICKIQIKMTSLIKETTFLRVTIGIMLGGSLTIKRKRKSKVHLIKCNKIILIPTLTILIFRGDKWHGYLQNIRIYYKENFNNQKRKKSFRRSLMA